MANKILSDSSVEKAAVKYQAYSSAMPFVANSFFAFSFLAKCIISGHFAMEKAMSALAPEQTLRCNSPRLLWAKSGHSPYSITSSARPISVLGMLRPSVLARRYPQTLLEPRRTAGDGGFHRRAMGWCYTLPNSPLG